MFVVTETHESGVTKCTTGEAWDAFNWHHSSVFQCCKWTYNQVPQLLYHMLSQKCKNILIYLSKLTSFLISELLKFGINFPVSTMLIDRTLWNQLLPVVPNVYEVVTMVAPSDRYVCAIYVMHLEKQSCVSMVALFLDLWFIMLTHLLDL